MARKDTRPEPTTRAWQVAVGVEPFDWENRRRSRGCGYIFTRVRLVDRAWTCVLAQDVAGELADALQKLLPTDFALAITQVIRPGDFFTRCGHDVDCQRGYFPIIQGAVLRPGDAHDSFMVLNMGGYHFDPTGATRAGYTRVVVPTSAAYPPTAGQHRYFYDAYPQWVTFMNWLAAHRWLLADKYGRKCQLDPWVSLHRSAFYQK